MSDHLVSVYSRAPIAPMSGRGAWLMADDGREHLDCVGGIAAARAEGLLIAGGGDNCIRLLPPLNLTAAEAAAVLAWLGRAFEALAAPALAA